MPAAAPPTPARDPSAAAASGRPAGISPRPGVWLSAGVIGALIVGAGPVAADAGSAGHSHAFDAPPAAAAASPSSRAAVAAPNLRIGVVYDYGHLDSTSTVFVGPVSVSTLELDDEDGDSVAGELVGTVPLVAFTGLRASVRGGFHDARRSLDALEPDSSRIDAFGALAELFARDPALGAFAIGAGFDRLEGEGGLAANQLTGRVDAQIFFPDLGAGPLDWFSRFEFRHREVEGDGQPFDVDADVYDVTGGARWYATPDLALVLSGRWQRVEEEFLSEDDQTGSLGLHWRLPLPLRPVSVELFAAGTAGVSEYKESPYRGDHRLVYGGRAGITLRLFSGASLFDSMRRYD